MLGPQLRRMHNLMDLKTYTNQLRYGATAEFAHKLGVSRVYLSQLAARQDGRLPSPSLCVRIEEESQRIVTRQELRPADWHEIWPELRLKPAPADNAQAA